MRRVNVPELDQRFTDVAESFNEQQEHHEAMLQHIRNLKQSWDCTGTDTQNFADCIKKIRDEQQATYRISLKMKCYDFSLTVEPVQEEHDEQPLPPNLKLAQDEIKGLSDSAKATVSKGTPLQQLISWMLQGQGQMAQQVKEAAGTFQEQGRLTANLDENIKEVRRAKELSLGYRKVAAEVYNEAAQIAGVCV
ncbi:uncharacterized protein si:ch73-345f18.3 isoform X2 [Nothobranchius furzeri]|nr:uncharacterized protein si:ch73-345f18.3 isoform X2 [Nothobranchius furzeri]KAF7221719.1 transcript variant X2 [Nothobranchius furzeri]